MAHIAIATYPKLPALAQDDQLLKRELEARGCQVSAVVWNDQTIDFKQFDLLVIRSCWDYYLHLPEFLSWVKKLQTSGLTVINPPQTILWNSDKSYLRELENYGVHIPATHWLRPSDGPDFFKALAEIFRKTGWKTAVLKPVVSAGAYKTVVVHSDQSASSYGLVTSELSGHSMFQEYLPEIINGELSIIFFGQEFSHAVTKKPKAGDFRVQAEHGGQTTPFHPTAQQLAQVQVILKKVPVPHTYARVDVVERGEELCLMELELIEPNLFFSSAPGSERKFAQLVESIAQTKQDQRKLPARRL